MAFATNSSNVIFSGGGQRLGSLAFSVFGFEKVIKQAFTTDDILRELTVKQGLFTGQSFGAASSGVAQGNLFSQFLQGTLNIRDLYRQMESIRNHYMVEAIINPLVGDAMASDPQTSEIFTISIDSKFSASNKANIELEKFEKKFKLDQFVRSFIEDAIFYGEYALENRGEPGKGITNILDTSPPGSTIAVYQGVDPSFFYRVDRSIKSVNSGGTDLITLKPQDYWHISVFPRKLRLSIIPKDIRTQLADLTIESYLKIGKPLFSSVFDKLLELEAFETGQLAKDFADTRRRSLYGVQAPAGLELGEQLDTFNTFYENLLNETDVDLQQFQTLESVRRSMLGVGKPRVIPQQPDRGEISVMDLRNPGSDDVQTRIEDRRRIITSTIGVPFEYVFGQADSNPVSLRQFIRYSRLVNLIQVGVAESLKRQARVHLQNLGDEFRSLSLSDINVAFYNTINVAELDRLEFMDTEISMIENTNRFIDELSNNEQNAKFVDQTEKMRWIQKTFQNFQGAEKIIQVPAKGSDAEQISNLKENVRHLSEELRDTKEDLIYNARNSAGNMGMDLKFGS